MARAEPARPRWPPPSRWPWPRRKRTLLVEVEGRQGIAQLFETEALPYEERKIAVAPDGGEVYALAIDAELALLDYLQMFYKLGSAGRALRKLGAIDFATTVAPGVRDVLLTGKACEAVRRKDRGGRFVYDYVVMDAPPTGRITRFLNVNDEVAGLAKIGPIHNQAQAVMRVLKSPETAVHLVTLLEEMPVQETADGIEELRGARLPVGRVVVNMVRPEVLDGDGLELAESVPRSSIARALSSAGLGGARRGDTPSGWWTRCSRRRGSTPSGTRWRPSSAPCWRASVCRCTSFRCSRRAWTWPACTNWRGTCAARACHDRPRPHGRR
ncbi:hypothetical protein SHKM778_03490 [Streptomyces sp. KM77-8]|uniref:ArsA/GET3 Anion-transporting ATPase-like domain-containing protein n=1 Tax=Streptomyces haneummycinicus TaxID=3074435 RepID=A0AAT9H963_9ACTN